MNLINERVHHIHISLGEHCVDCSPKVHLICKQNIRWEISILNTLVKKPPCKKHMCRTICGKQSLWSLWRWYGTLPCKTLCTSLIFLCYQQWHLHWYLHFFSMAPNTVCFIHSVWLTHGLLSLCLLPLKDPYPHKLWCTFKNIWQSDTSFCENLSLYSFWVGYAFPSANPYTKWMPASSFSVKYCMFCWRLTTAKMITIKQIPLRRYPSPSQCSHE